MNTRERILKYIESKNISKYRFYKDVGLSNGYLDKEGNVGSDVCEKISYQYNDLSIEWLITGRGEMLKSEKKPEIKKYNIDDSLSSIVAEPENKIEGETVIPLYDINAAAGMRLLFESGKQNIIDTIKIPYITKSDGAIFITGDSMYPLMKSGDIAVYRQIHSLDYLHYGDIYIVSYSVEGDEYVVIKYVQRSDKKDHLKLVSYNEHYNPVDIPISSVMAIAIVQANIRYNTMT
ncbi:S24 family peptidase [Dysgonomonas termitidis]|uniref:Helix-turn-helix transcriptional regulator n=1 Tax=Dysgonomonas termitidis TaxID=1516126 RepID=A0ABV9KUF6_9BACT